MAFPTVTVTQGSGLTINTIPNAGQATMANSLGVVVASDQSAFPILGRTSMPVVTPVVTSNGVYASGNEIGGLMTFPVGGAGTGGELKHLRVTSRSILTTALNAFVFTTNPTSTTWANNAAPAINPADIPSLLCGVPLSAPYNDLGAMTIWWAGNLGMKFLAANLYVVLLAAAATTLTSTTAADITVQLGMTVD
jgi:hypothetical protein